MKTRQQELEDLFYAGLLEGQVKKPQHIFCECYQKHGHADLKCKKCNGTGMVKRADSDS